MGKQLEGYFYFLCNLYTTRKKSSKIQLRQNQAHTPKSSYTFHSLSRYHTHKILHTIVLRVIRCLPGALRKSIQKHNFKTKKMNSNSSFGWLRSYNCWKLLCTCSLQAGFFLPLPGMLAVPGCQYNVRQNMECYKKEQKNSLKCLFKPYFPSFPNTHKQSQSLLEYKDNHCNFFRGWHGSVLPVVPIPTLLAHCFFLLTLRLMEQPG